jgi:putative flippase GtrA
VYTCRVRCRPKRDLFGVRLAILTLRHETDPAQVDCSSTTCDGGLCDRALRGAELVLVSVPPGVATPLVSKFIAYFQVGAVCAALDVAGFWALLHLTDLKYLSLGISFVISTGANYFLAAHFVFDRSRRSRGAAIALVYATSAIAVGINLASFSTAIEVFGVNPLLAKIFGVGVGFCWNFTSRYFWIFRS